MSWLENHPVQDVINEMREAGAQDAEAYHRVFQLCRTDPESQPGPSDHAVHAYVESMAQFIPYPEYWKAGFWGWWEQHRPV